MDKKEAIFFWATVVLYVAGAVVFLIDFAFGRERWRKYGWAAAGVGFALHTAAIVARWTATGHPPVMRVYENTLAGSWVLMVFFFLLSRKPRNLSFAAVVLLPFTTLMLGFGVMNTPAMEPYSDTYRTPWLAVHIVFAWLAYCSFTVAFALGILYLLKERQLARGGKGRIDKLPEPGVLDEICGKYVVFGFITCTIMIVAGAIWASKLWGSYWNWDPIETWTLICWMVYGLYLHLRFVFGWRGRRMAWLAIAALVTVIISFFGVTALMNTMHNFKAL